MSDTAYSPKLRQSKFYASLKLANKNCPFFKLINFWLDYCRADGISHTTLYDYSDKVSRFYWWWSFYTGYYESLGAHPCCVTVAQAREFAAFLRDPTGPKWGSSGPVELSAATIAGYGRTIKVFFAWLEREEYIPQTPFNKSVKFSNRHKKDTVIKAVSQNNLTTIFSALTTPEKLATFSGKRDLAMISFLLDSGIRRGELLSMTIENLDLVNLRCLINGKTGQRYAYFSDRCKAVLMDYLKLRYEAGDEGPLWLNISGEMLRENAFGAVIWRIEKTSGIKFHAHQLRHAFGTMLAAKGVNSYSLKQLMGHSSVTTTMIYSNQNPDSLSAIHAPNSPLTTMADELPGLRRSGRPRKWK